MSWNEGSKIGSSQKSGTRFDRAFIPSSGRGELTAERLPPGKAETGLRHSDFPRLGRRSHPLSLNCSILSPEIRHLL